MRSVRTVPVIPYELPEGVIIDPNNTSVEVTVKGITPQCRNGDVCSTAYKASCSNIENAAIYQFQYGNIHDGLMCPELSPYYGVCNISYYCPDPTTQKPCPAGYFCPYKTRVPFVKCLNCPEGSPTLLRDTWGYIVLSLYFVFAICYIIIQLLKSYSEGAAARIEKLKSQVVNIMDVEQHLVSKQEKLNRLRPKFEIILNRLKGLSFDSQEEKAEDTDSSTRDEASSECIVIDKNGNVKFDALKFFHMIDQDGSGTISYKELNAILQFDPPELQEFIKQMQELGKESGDTISKDTFVKFFLYVLEKVTHFQLTEEEAGHYWDDMARKTGINQEVGKIDLNEMYNTSISNSLTDTQIRDVIKEFKTVKMANDTEGDDTEGDDTEDNFVARNGKVSRAHFIKKYPQILNEIIMESNLGKAKVANSFDITFRDLKLAIKAGRNLSVNVVDGVTGRIQGGTMTAVMGGSGAGKTSLLNALCGRAYYGDTSGDVYINGNPAQIEDFSELIGFVPQDDIVFPELTVKENFMFSGKFRLPRGSTQLDIEDLADEVMADLGLSRKASSIVGDVTRRGLSGGEKKRVNIGLEMMAQPSILFLDEPTSGLDSSSALLVMSSLKELVTRKGVTVCAVIHQPRKFIFDLFDSLVLLGDGGRMVYHGAVDEVEEYFRDLFYELPAGENVADWLIDISSGRVAPEKYVPRDDYKSRELSTGDGNKETNGENGSGDGTENRAGSNMLTNALPNLLQNVTARTTSALTTTRGASGSKEAEERNAAKLRREMLYEHWNTYFNDLLPSEKMRYEPPIPSELPKAVIKPSFLRQFVLQCQRIAFLFWRNRVIKLIESTLIIAATTIVTFLLGHLDPILPYFQGSRVVNIPFDAMISGQNEVWESFFIDLFGGPSKGLVNTMNDYQFIGMVASILLAIMATRSLVGHRLEFYREAGSGYNVNAYFLAINLYTTVEHGIQVTLAAVLVVWLRHPMESTNIIYLWFFLVMWISVSWALLIPLLVPPQSVIMIITLFTAVCGVMFAGVFGFSIEDFYNNDVLAIIVGFFGSTRFFVESVAVSIYKCLPPQYGFTQSLDAFGFPPDKNMFEVTGLGLNDPEISVQSCDGWFWYTWPAALVGLTLRFIAFGAINTFHRSMQAKKSFWHKLRHDGSARLYIETLIFWLVLAGLMVATCWSILRKN